MKEKIIQIVVIPEKFCGSFKSCVMLLTDRGNVYIATADRPDFRKKIDLPDELQPE